MTAKELHAKWQAFKSGAGAEMIKAANLKFNAGLGPQLDTLEKKKGTPDGQKAAEKLKAIVKDYHKILDGAKTAKINLKPTTGLERPARPSGEQFAMQRKMGGEILDQIKVLAEGHKVVGK